MKTFDTKWQDVLKLNECNDLCATGLVENLISHFVVAAHSLSLSLTLSLSLSLSLCMCVRPHVHLFVMIVS